MTGGNFTTVCSCATMKVCGGPLLRMVGALENSELFWDIEDGVGRVEDNVETLIQERVQI